MRRDTPSRLELLQGTLDLLILRTLLTGPAHGHAIAKTIQRNSEDLLLIEDGCLYPALHRLLKRGWIAAQPGASENNRRAIYYRLSAKGRKGTVWWDFHGTLVSRPFLWHQRQVDRIAPPGLVVKAHPRDF